MKRIYAVLMILVILSCAKKESAAGFVVPEYKDWQKPVAEVLNYPVPGHGDGQRIIFGNKLAYSPKNETTADRVVYTFPDSTVIIKEVYEKGADIATALPALTIMVKDSKSPDARDGWLYYMRPPGGEVMQIKGKMCAECHSAANENSPYFDKNPKEDFRDYIFAPFF